MKTKTCSRPAAVQFLSPRVVALGLLALLLVLALTGCENTTPVANINPAGVYKLVSVDGQTVPCTTKHEGTTISIKSGMFAIATNGTCRSLMTFAVPERGEISRETKAAYVQKGRELTMRWEGAGTTIGHIKGNEFTMNNEGMILSYRR